MPKGKCLTVETATYLDLGPVLHDRHQSLLCHPINLSICRLAFTDRSGFRCSVGGLITRDSEADTAEELAEAVVCQISIIAASLYSMKQDPPM